MDYTPRYSARSNLVSSATTYTVPIGYQLNFKAHWHNNMYSMQNLDSPTKQQLFRESIDSNKRNFSFCRMYSSKPSLNNMPKKETLWQSMFRSATNLLGEQLTRGTSSFMKNWSNMNNPLSVTVVSPEFYKSVHQEKEQQLINSSEDFIVPRSWSKQSQSSDDKLPIVLHDNKIMSERATKINSDSNDSDKRWKEYKYMYIDFNKSQELDLNVNEQFVNSVNNSDSKDEDFESHFNIVVIDKKEGDDPVIIEKPEELTPEVRQEPSQTSEESASVTTMLTNAYNKVVSSMVDYLQLGRTEPDSEPESDSELSSLLTKRGCSPKTRPKKHHDVSSGRGRGRAKSQLRRSGVSQTRHRKERSRYDYKPDIKSDIDSWEELEYHVEGMDECDHAPQHHSQDDIQHVGFTFGDVTMKMRKPKKNKSCIWGEIALVPQDLDEVGREFKDNHHHRKPAVRPRLLSDSSVDSEDSYCIVFEGDNCNDECDFETDVDGYTETEETETEDEVLTDTPIPTRRTKVRFNLDPVVHPMVQWNYAYRAARRGPWEEMARDRERFRSRINCIGRILEPVLGSQHRIRIWHERFDDQDIFF